MSVEERRALVRQSQKKRRDKLRELNLCIQCGKTTPEDGKTLCPACMKKQSKYSMKYTKRVRKERADA